MDTSVDGFPPSTVWYIASQPAPKGMAMQIGDLRTTVLDTYGAAVDQAFYGTQAKHM